MDQVKQKTVSKFKEYTILLIKSLTQNDADIKEEDLNECIKQQDSKRIQKLEEMFNEDKTTSKAKKEKSETKQSQKEKWDQEIHYTIPSDTKNKEKHINQTETKTQEQR